MKAIDRRSLLFGFLVWLIPFIVSVAIFPIRTSSRALFESIMPVVVAISVVLFSILYLRRVEADLFKTGVKSGYLGQVSLVWGHLDRR
ncbi:MAG: hypothetical protein MAG451_02752 [Anaerolineales bacterium]|nr:hypothetical protein [Anaerolineales bacterium]